MLNPVMATSKMRDEMMTKRLPYISHHRPYKYQELRRKFKAGADTSAAKGEEEYRNLLQSRDRTTLARSNTNLAATRSNTNLAAISRENLAASRDSLVIAEETTPADKGGKPPRGGAARQPYNDLRHELNSRQTSLDKLSKRPSGDGKEVYSFTLSKADRSKSEPVLFPPLSEKTKTGKTSQLLPNDLQKSTEHLPSQATPAVERKDKENKPISNIKFPIVSRYDLYKHLGISQNRRKRTRRDTEVPEYRNYAKSKPTQPQQQIPRIMPDTSGKSRNVSGLYTHRDENKKIEMYKQWHEDQANQRRVHDANRSHDYDTKEATRLANMYKEHYQVEDIRPRNNERLPVKNRRDSTLPKIGLTDRSTAGRVMEAVLDGSLTDRSKRDTNSRATNQRPESPPAQVPVELLQRQYSSNTWETWRHHNDSYAYDDVDKYMEENELMDDEKIFFIKQWITSVARAVLEDDKDSDDDDDDINDVGTISSTDHMDKCSQEHHLTKLQMSAV